MAFIFYFFLFFHKDADGRLQIYFSSGQRTLWEGNSLKKRFFTEAHQVWSKLLLVFVLSWLVVNVFVFVFSRSCWQSLRRQENCMPSKPWRKKTLWLVMRWTGVCVKGPGRLFKEAVYLNHKNLDTQTGIQGPNQDPCIYNLTICNLGSWTL